MSMSMLTMTPNTERHFLIRRCKCCGIILTIQKYNSFLLCATLDGELRSAKNHTHLKKNTAVESKQASENRIVPDTSCCGAVILLNRKCRRRRWNHAYISNIIEKVIHPANVWEYRCRHDCRHNFLRCVKYGVRENDRERMLGHSFGGDVTNAVYGHRTLEELRTEIEKIKVPFVTNCD